MKDNELYRRTLIIFNNNADVYFFITMKNLINYMTYKVYQNYSSRWEIIMDRNFVFLWVNIIINVTTEQQFYLLPFFLISINV